MKEGTRKLTGYSKSARGKDGTRRAELWTNVSPADIRDEFTLHTLID